jgi:uncharacterized protein (DUF1778 family)
MAVPPKGTVRMNIHVEENLHKAFKAAAALQGKRMTDVVIAFIKGYVREHMPSELPRKASKK